LEAGLSLLPWLLVAAGFFFALGWLGAKIDVKRLLTESRALPKAYFKGVNFLLNEQPDKAIDALVEASKQHPEAIELQFALGQLFRRRGEIDRALRVHKDLSERSGLSLSERSAALFETALDYHKSGLLDYAEKILTDLIKSNTCADTQLVQIQKLLLNLYQQERQWRKAIDVARLLDADVAQASRQYMSQIANFYCELAIEYYLAGNAMDANKALSLALAEYPRCVRANLLGGEWLAAAGNHNAAILAWQKIEAQDAAFIGLCAKPMLAAYASMGEDTRGMAAISRYQQDYAQLDLFDALFQATLKNAGANEAYQLVKNDLRQNPTLVGLERLLEAQLLNTPATTDAANASTDERADLEIEHAIVHSHASRLAVYLCQHCGFKAKQYYWHCPACASWDSFPPRRTAEYDTAERHLARSQVEHIKQQ